MTFYLLLGTEVYLPIVNCRLFTPHHTLRGIVKSTVPTFIQEHIREQKIRVVFRCQYKGVKWFTTKIYTADR